MSFAFVKRLRLAEARCGTDCYNRLIIQPEWRRTPLHEAPAIPVIETRAGTQAMRTCMRGFDSCCRREKCGSAKKKWSSRKKKLSLRQVEWSS
jgi:hypothetical protein